MLSPSLTRLSSLKFAIHANVRRFNSNGQIVYGESVGKRYLLAKPYCLGFEFTGTVIRLCES
jgi:hypothetical protein